MGFSPLSRRHCSAVADTSEGAQYGRKKKKRKLEQIVAETTPQRQQENRKNEVPCSSSSWNIPATAPVPNIIKQRGG